MIVLISSCCFIPITDTPETLPEGSLRESSSKVESKSKHKDATLL